MKTLNITKKVEKANDHYILAKTHFEAAQYLLLKK
jgi:hypothetical protein